jgi:MFS family permease
VLCIAVIAIVSYYIYPIISGLMSDLWSSVVSAIIAISACSPFLWALLRSGTETEEVNKLWESGPAERVKLTALGLLRLALGALFLTIIIGMALPKSGWYGIFAVVIILFVIFYSPHARKRSEKITKRFTENLTERERQQ